MFTTIREFAKQSFGKLNDYIHLVLIHLQTAVHSVYDYALSFTDDGTEDKSAKDKNTEKRQETETTCQAPLEGSAFGFMPTQQGVGSDQARPVTKTARAQRERTDTVTEHTNTVTSTSGRGKRTDEATDEDSTFKPLKETIVDSTVETVTEEAVAAAVDSNGPGPLGVAVTGIKTLLPTVGATIVAHKEEKKQQQQSSKEASRSEDAGPAASAAPALGGGFDRSHQDDFDEQSLEPVEILLDKNYVTLRPGERSQIRATVLATGGVELKNQNIEFVVSNPLRVSLRQDKVIKSLSAIKPGKETGFTSMYAKIGDLQSRRVRINVTSTD